MATYRQKDSAAGAVGWALAKWVLINIVAGAILRIVLMCHPITVTSSLGIGQWLGIFALGIVNDTCIATLMSIPLACFWMSSGHWKFRRPQSYVFITVLIVTWIYVTFGCATLWEFNKPLARILSGVLVYWTASFALRAFVPGIRRGWMVTWTAIILFIYLALFVMNTVGEWFFWNEFGVRYNFIAVDYLVYTNEVIGNIMQSYSMGWIITGAVTVTLLLEILLYRNEIRQSVNYHHSGWRVKTGSALVAASALALFILPVSERTQHSDNAWYNGLQANGVYSFVKAFTSNKLDYEDFYVTCPPEQVSAIVRKPTTSPNDSVHASPITPNIVMITMESMSADYMSRFGQQQRLTPVLDSLWDRSVAFECMFAAGNRTVRGLEALVLSRPPSPGESIIKREDNTGYPSIADTFRAMGYDMTFYYGGNSYFDNMESFFAGLGYNIHDNKTMTDADITSQTVWGVCDGDVYRRMLCEIDSVTSTGTPVLAHIMTTSNHRPYIYPDIPGSPVSDKQSRVGAVWYSDYALGRFIDEASSKPWFGNTVFVISADHCASSAGSTELPLANYHIPALIYAPALIQPAHISQVTSQIDIMPTLFGLLGWRTDANLYGQDVMAETYVPRAFVATYQDLGYLRGDTLTVLSPGRAYRQYVMSPTADDAFATRLVDTPSTVHVNEAAAWYQSADN